MQQEIPGTHGHLQYFIPFRNTLFPNHYIHGMEDKLSHLKPICKALRALRMKHQYTEAYVAAQLDMSQSAYSQLESHGKGLRLDRLLRLAAFYGIGVADFFSDNGPADRGHAECAEERKKLRKRIEELEATLKKWEARGVGGAVVYNRPLEYPAGSAAGSFL